MSGCCARAFPTPGISGTWIARRGWRRRVPALDNVMFQAKLGTQGERVRRLTSLAATIAPQVGADPAQAARAARTGES